jgi:hypothetical protein
MPRPSFDQLPLTKDGPPLSAWGLYVENDRLGSLNLLTPDFAVEATKEIKTGIRIGLDNHINFLVRPSHSRLGLTSHTYSYVQGSQAGS